MAARSGEGTIQIDGLVEFRRDLKELGGAWPRELTKVNKLIAAQVAAKAQDLAAGYGSMTAAAAKGIKGSATAVSAKIAVTSNPAFAIAAIYGAKRHSGWYGNARHSSATTPQFPEWVGNSWDVGGSGGPRGVNDAIRATKDDDIPGYYLAAIAELTSRAFPL